MLEDAYYSVLLRLLLQIPWVTRYIYFLTFFVRPLIRPKGENVVLHGIYSFFIKKYKS